MIENESSVIAYHLSFVVAGLETAAQSLTAIGDVMEVGGSDPSNVRRRAHALLVEVEQARALATATLVFGKLKGEDTEAVAEMLFRVNEK